MKRTIVTVTHDVEAAVAAVVHLLVVIELVVVTGHKSFESAK